MRPLGQEAGDPDPDGELGLLAGVERARLGLERPDDLGLAAASPTRPGRGPGRTCGGPSRPASGGPSRPRGTRGPGSGRPPGSSRSPSRSRNSSRSSRSNSNSSRSYRGELAEVLVLEVQAVAGVGPVGQRLPVPFRGLGVGREVLLHRLADRVAEPGPRPCGGPSSTASSKVLPLKSRGVELDAQPLAGPLGEAGRAVVVGRGTGRRAASIWSSIISRISVLGSCRRRGSAGGSRRPASAARPSPRRIRAGSCGCRSSAPRPSSGRLRCGGVTIRLSIASPSFMPSRVSTFVDPLAGEDPHQVVFERQVEPAAAGVALPAGTAAKLSVDAAGLVPLGADDVQAAQLGDLAGPRPSSSRAARSRRRAAFHSSCGTSSRVAYLSCSCAQAIVSGLPPRMMSVPRPAMFVAMVTAPMRPAWATISASRPRSRLGVEHLVLDAAPLQHARRASRYFSTSVVPIRIGRPVSWTSTISSTTASHFSLLGAVDDVGVVDADAAACWSGWR